MKLICGYTIVGRARLEIVSHAGFNYLYLNGRKLTRADGNETGERILRAYCDGYMKGSENASYEAYNKYVGSWGAKKPAGYTMPDTPKGVMEGREEKKSENPEAVFSEGGVKA